MDEQLPIDGHYQQEQARLLINYNIYIIITLLLYDTID